MNGVFSLAENAIRGVARETRNYIESVERRKAQEKHEQERRQSFEKYMPVIAEKAASVAGENDPPSTKELIDEVM